MEQEHLFLTMSQAATAICLDFRGYGPQTMLFCEVLRALCDPSLNYKREPGREGLWVSDADHGKMHWLDGADLVAYMCARITEADLDHEALAAVCRMVFQAPCQAARHPDTGRWGVRVQTDMAAFHCRQCGQCCRQLNYRDGMTKEDVARLKQLGRDDVLEWVRPSRTVEGHRVYRIWVIPGTNQFTRTCPFLKRGASRDRWICSIHDAKPDICKNYPVSRKHALMTGCPGFDISRSGSKPRTK